MASTTNLYHSPNRGCECCPMHRTNYHGLNRVRVDYCMAGYFNDSYASPLYVSPLNDGYDVPGRLPIVAPGTPAPAGCPLREHGVLVISSDFQE